jgi:DNA-binding HxlR family transcriptional regulator
MGRCGAKSTQKEVKTSIVSILAENSEGLSFNQIFKQLKSEGILGSYSVLSRALKDLHERLIIDYEDKPTKAKIPRRVYTLTEPKFRELIQTYAKVKERMHTPVEKLVLDKSLLEQLFFEHVINVIRDYKTLLRELNPSEQDAIWKLLLNIDLNHMQVFMESVAKAISEEKISIKDANEVANLVHTDVIQRS